MKRSLIYELRRISLPLCIFTAIASAIFAVNALTTEYIGPNYYNPSAPIGAKNSLVYIPMLILFALCYIVPALQFSYRMNKRSTDLWYALPINRKKLMSVRLIGGLLLLLIPYTISYFLGFTIIACSENLFDLVWYIPLYLASLPTALCLFGINAFCFTRANTVRDGIIFIFILNLSLLMPLLFLLNYFYRYLPSLFLNSLGLMPIGAPIHIFVFFDGRILNHTTYNNTSELIFSCILCAAESAGAYFGLFYTADKHKAENAGQISDSIFGYKVLIPWFVFFSVLINPSLLIFGTSSSLSLINILLVFICGLIAYFVYRRSFRLKKCDLLSLVLSFTAGILVLLLIQNVILPCLS